MIWNLLTNAIKFTPEQGQVDIDLSVVTELQAMHPCHAASSQSYAQLQIRDTGLGISADFLPHIFDRFRQADSSTTRSQGGLGLGLAIVHHLVEQHQGCVWAESPGLNQGATFTFAIPLLKADSQATALTDQENASISHDPDGLAGMPILIADDDADTRDFLAFLLESQGAVVTKATSAQEVLQRIHSIHPTLLLCDISMPDMDGYALIEKIRTQFPEPLAQVPAIAITAHARVSDQTHALEAGFQSHLPKPIEPEVLIQTILQVTSR